eukprot:CAMPEP_0167771182 /NCGR_PEP_ID=MMETSP0111_2-20121227/132_1 /TAXON_ID=91324 /ORGANISM="Lotharella globosa, Strain CCCM811" /LENGTH=116 /DNA_ID=CAMNT_0007660499 /DNA_START=325 /DNA_END=675 /DNA_ORIENTATION=-
MGKLNRGFNRPEPERDVYKSLNKLNSRTGSRVGAFRSLFRTMFTSNNRDAEKQQQRKQELRDAAQTIKIVDEIDAAGEADVEALQKQLQAYTEILEDKERQIKNLKKQLTDVGLTW